MNYELAKKLKDAGFWNVIDVGDLFYKKNDTTVWTYYPQVSIIDDSCIRIPTLSELIEACGDNFGSLTLIPHVGKQKREWEALASILGVAVGQTPEEAVANLWLALNKKTT